MLAACPRFAAGEARDFTDAGTKRHEVFRMLCERVRGISDAEIDALLEDLPSEDREGVRWAFDQVRLTAPFNDYPVQTEVPFTFMGPDFQAITGHIDVLCGPVVFDLKWRFRDYRAQMACYAMKPISEGHAKVKAYVLYGEPKRRFTLHFTEDSAMDAISEIIERAKDPQATPAACDYCGWCANKLTCTAQTASVAKVANARGLAWDKFESWLDHGAHTSEIEDDAELMGEVLRIARAVSSWCEAAEHHAKKMAQEKGIVPSGFKIQTRQGNRFIASVTDAFARAGLPQADFLQACEVKLSSLTDVYAGFSGMKKAPAERELERKLGEVVQRKKPSISLVEEKTNNNEGKE